MNGERDEPRVLVDATAVPSDRGGVGRYIDGVVAALTGDILIACQQRDTDYYRSIAPAATVLPQSRIASTGMRLIWEQVALPALARRTHATVIFSPHYTVPILTRLPRVVTFHDATFFSDPEVHTQLKRRFFRAWIRISARRARGVLVPSKATAAELDRFISRPDGYEVAYHGVDTRTFHVPSAEELSGLAASTDIGRDRWIAFLGTIEPRKNLPALVRAYGAVTANWRREWGAVPVLAIAGGTGWETELDAEVAAVNSPGRIVRLGFLPLESLSAFLGGAELVSYPSLGEGFGLPVLEAMACGSAVLTTDRLALPEVGGDAVAYSDVSADAIANGLRRLLDDAARRAQLGRRGLERAKTFTWRKSAIVHESVFRRASGMSSRESS